MLGRAAPEPQLYGLVELARIYSYPGFWQLESRILRLCTARAKRYHKKTSEFSIQAAPVLTCHYSIKYIRCTLLYHNEPSLTTIFPSNRERTNFFPVHCCWVVWFLLLEIFIFFVFGKFSMISVLVFSVKDV